MLQYKTAPKVQKLNTRPSSIKDLTVFNFAKPRKFSDQVHFETHHTMEWNYSEIFEKNSNGLFTVWDDLSITGSAAFCSRQG